MIYECFEFCTRKQDKNPKTIFCSVSLNIYKNFRALFIHLLNKKKIYCCVFVFNTIYSIYNQHFYQLFFFHSVHCSAFWDRCLKLNHYAHNGVYDRCVDTHTCTQRLTLTVGVRKNTADTLVLECK